jgi:hypothetical protein
MALPRLEGRLVFDGMPDEAAWEAIAPLEVVQHWPEFRGPMSERTEIRLAYDDDFLYASGRFYDDPAGIRANSLRRDRWEGDDVFELVVDSYDDDQTALKFTTTPLGVLLDHEVRNDAQPAPGSPPLNADWNGVWDAATRRTDDGWFAEIRIPLSTLGFSVTADGVVMGVIASRYIARRDEKHIFPAIPPEWESADVKPSRARDVRLTGISERRPLQIVPYALTGVERFREPGAAPIRAPEAAMPTEAGVDIKVGLSSNLTLDLTANTDFAQVEADNLEVNLDRFGLFFPEKRQFFQERSSTFDFDVGEGRLFHSRTIGLSDGGEPLRILGGARLSGRLGAWDVGALSMQVAGDGGAAGVNDGVVRLRRTLGEGREFGGIFTSRLGTDGTAALSMGLDGRWTVGPDHVTVQVAQTRNDGVGDASFTDRSLARLFWQRRGLDGFSYDVDLLASGAAYDPALGFEGRNDFRAAKARLRYSWQPGGNGIASRLNAQLTGRAYVRNEDDRLDSGLVRAQAWAQFRGGHWLNVAFNVFREDVRAAFDLPGATVPAGRYDGTDLFVYFELSQSRRVGTSANLWFGDAFDGRRRSFTLEPWWRLNRHLTVGGMLQHNRLHFAGRGQTVNADQARLRLSAALDTRLSAEAFVQYSAAAERVSTNLRLRYRLAEGRDLFVVFDEGRDLEDRYGLDSAVLGRTDRRLLIKTTWAIRR